ncbi:energy transducer TonB family protein [Sphingosinithalassobacter portus]|uniref:energy transducer TonB family protein n=1 Tax=Stakelama portus TaxID=2676234 RepID=UPI00137AA505|nr:TonB family protein [Sphingosinithalassobacter portus]
MSRSANPSDRSGSGGYRPSGRERWAGAGSATAILALLASLVMLAPAVTAPQAEQQALRLFDLPPEESAVPEPEPKAAQPAAQPRKPVPPRTSTAPSTPAAPSPLQSPARQAASSPSAAPPQLAAPSLPEQASPQPIAPSAPVRTREPANVRDSYASALWSHINTRRPRGVRIRGEAVIAFTVDRGGAVHDVSLDRSSGNPLLDRLALRTVTRAAPMPAPPAALAGSALRFTITVSFDQTTNR